MLAKKRKISDNSDKEITNKASLKHIKGKEITKDAYKTISVAIPSSVIDNAQSKELRSYLVGQIARTCALFRVDEIIIYHDSEFKGTIKDKLNFCLTNLQYLETPQYLKKPLFPFIEDLALAGLMNPLDIHHHLKTNEFCRYREGIVLKRPVKENKGSWVDIGLKKYCFIENTLPEKTRVTIKLDKEAEALHERSELNIDNGNTNKQYNGKVVSSFEPKKKGLYWGYLVRVAETFEDIFENSIFNNEKYDLTIGTSLKGKDSIKINFPEEYKHCLIVFNGIQDIENAIENDENSKIKSSEMNKIFNFIINPCPNQGSKTIRTEEAMMISLSILQYKL